MIFLDIAYQAALDSDSCEMENKWGEPCDCLAYCLEKVSSHSTEKASRWRLAILLSWADVPGRWKWLERLGQSTWEEKAAQRENPGCLQSDSLESSTDNWSVCVRGNYPSHGKESPERIRGNKTCSPHRAENNLCSYLQECKNHYNSWDFKWSTQVKKGIASV